MSTPEARQPSPALTLIRAATIFPVRDLDASLAFYRRLGFRTDTYDEGYGFARRERLRLHLRAVPELEPGANLSGVFVYVAGIDALHAEWLGYGLRVLSAAEEAEPADAPNGLITGSVEAKPWRVREFTLLDPDGNRLRFGEEL